MLDSSSKAEEANLQLMTCVITIFSPAQVPAILLPSPLLLLLLCVTALPELLCIPVFSPTQLFFSYGF
jgi:hypothetical protein